MVKGMFENIYRYLMKINFLENCVKNSASRNPDYKNALQCCRKAATYIITRHCSA